MLPVIYIYVINIMKSFMMQAHFLAFSFFKDCSEAMDEVVLNSWSSWRLEESCQADWFRRKYATLPFLETCYWMFFANPMALLFNVNYIQCFLGLTWRNIIVSSGKCSPECNANSTLYIHVWNHKHVCPNCTAYICSARNSIKCKGSHLKWNSNSLSCRMQARTERVHCVSWQKD